MSDEGFIPVRIPADCKPPELAAASAFLTAAKSKQQVRLKDGRGFIAWFLFISLCVALIMLLKANDRSAKPPAGNEPPTAQVRTPADVRVAFVLLLAGVACIVGGIVQLRWARRLPGRWHGQKFYRFSEDGVTVERPGRRDHYRWPRFVRLDETPDLLLLGCEPYQALVFPKRLFADEAEVARVKELLQKRLTRAAIPQAHGFPVQPVQPVQPAHGEETAQDVMRIEFQYTADDLVEAARPPGPGGESDALRASRRAKGRRNAWRMLRREPDSAWSRADVWRVRGGLLMLLGLLLMILATGYLGIRSQPAWFILCGIVFVLTAMTYGLALWKATRPGIRRHFASSPANADRCVVDIDDAGVVFDWPAWSCAVDWAAIKHTIETPALFLVIDDTPNTFIIPKRAFASDADRERCGQMLRQHVQGDVQWPT